MSSNLDLEEEAGPSANAAHQMYVLNEAISPELLARTMPAVVNVNMKNSSGLHVGPKFEFVTITQVVEDRELSRANRLPPDRDRVKKKRPWIGLCWAGLTLALMLTVALIIHLVIIAKTTESLLPEEVPWKVTRKMWNASYFHDNQTLDEYSPVILVIIQHTVSQPCFDFESCAAAMRNMQDYFLSVLGYDLPYNFVIGNDGRVYDSRLWNGQGFHTLSYNRCSIGIAFIGDYRDGIPVGSRVTDLQMSRLRMLLQEGVVQGHLRHDYSIVGASDLLNTYSPGENLYRAIQSLEHFDRTNFRYLTCDEIYDPRNHQLQNS